MAESDSVEVEEEVHGGWKMECCRLRMARRAQLEAGMQVGAVPGVVEESGRQLRG